MRAVQIQEHGDPDVLRVVERDEPRAGRGEVVVEMCALALNHLDLWVRRGVPGHPFPLPITPISDGAGRIAAVGEGVEHVAVGDEVFVLPGVSDPCGPQTMRGLDHLDPSYRILGESCDGLAAERVLLPAVNVQAKPASLSMVEAAAFPLTFLTAWNMVRRRADVQPGETVFVQAGASGVGVAAIQICRMLGARVFASAGSEQKCERLRDLGVELAIRYDLEDGLRDGIAELKRRAPGGGVEVVIDHVGKNSFATSMRCLARGGRFVTCGATTGPQVELMLNHVFFKSLSILGSTMGRRGDLLEIARLLDRGVLRPVVGRTLSGLDSIGEGHRLLEAREVFGKVVLDLE